MKYNLFLSFVAVLLFCYSLYLHLLLVETRNSISVNALILEDVLSYINGEISREYSNDLNFRF